MNPQGTTTKTKMKKSALTSPSLMPPPPFRPHQVRAERVHPEPTAPGARSEPQGRDGMETEPGVHEPQIS